MTNDQAPTSSLVAKGTKPRYLPLAKEAGLFLLSLLYFFIATNTLTGWLFVMSAFLFAILLFSWIGSKRPWNTLTLEMAQRPRPQKNRAFALKLQLSNLGPASFYELALKAPIPDWAEGQGATTVPIAKLVSLQNHPISLDFVPKKRGEHSFPELEIVGGFPFGLFRVKRRFQFSGTFLVHPTIIKLPNSLTRDVAGASQRQASSSLHGGDSLEFRSLREYRPGDDYRHIHWKASAKRPADAPLLLREFQRPQNLLLTLTLDTSSLEKQTMGGPERFEKLISVMASCLWAAHKACQPVTLKLYHSDQGWLSASSWQEQFDNLGRVQRLNDTSFSEWLGLWKNSATPPQRRIGQENRELLFSASSPDVLNEHARARFAKTYLMVDPGEKRVIPSTRMVDIDDYFLKKEVLAGV